MEAFRVRTTEPALLARLARHAPSPVVLEVGTDGADLGASLLR
jgi:hypothetical protein